ncbi:hypothetical protein POX_e06464 [Penicillium oxalicum]|uniref:hypothetical protein n=1 Tax=Penicillium oxalicum TaxID=69781 RepID=UPI0020B8ECA9|nr:hypothetical protein POX_e06464 [Penicillium oxalicum]KAI2788448.1 hypothetical protein POX_e06464 [Penicillium oxalicum]
MKIIAAKDRDIEGIARKEEPPPTVEIYTLTPHGHMVCTNARRASITIVHDD